MRSQGGRSHVACAAFAGGREAQPMQTIAAPRVLALALALGIASQASSADDPLAGARPAPGVARDDDSARARMSRLVPALEIIGLDLGVNRVADAAVDSSGTYDVSFRTLKHNLTHRWV